MLFPDVGNGNAHGNEAADDGGRGLVGVTACAAAVGLSKGTISKYAADGKIPVADRTPSGAPLFVVDEVRRALPDSVNENMRRGREADIGDDDVEERAAQSSDEPAGPTLKSVMIEERQTRIRSLQLKQAQDEGALAIVEELAREWATVSRGTRDAVEQFVADQAGRAYAFAAKPRTEGEWRILLIGFVRDAFAERERALAAEDAESDDDEFDVGEADG